MAASEIELSEQLASGQFIASAADGKAINLTLRMEKVDDTDMLQLINNADQSVLQSQSLADTDAVIIGGGLRPIDSLLTSATPSQSLLPSPTTPQAIVTRWKLLVQTPRGISWAPKQGTSVTLLSSA